MGWGGGTEFFDAALDIFLPRIHEDAHPALIEKWYEAFKYSDWDTEEESRYYEQLKPILKKLYPDWDWYD